MCSSDLTLRINPDSPFPVHAFYWVIPTDVAGTWNLALRRAHRSSHPSQTRYQLRLEQRYQEVTASAAAEGRPVPVTETTVVGDRLSFVIADSVGGRAITRRFSGRVAGDSVTGTMTEEGGPRLTWTAVRAERAPQTELESGDGVEPGR